MKCLAISLLGMLCGCSTIYTQVDDHRHRNTYYGFTVPRMYSGTVTDAHGLVADNVGLFALIDLPFSAVADTVLLPYTYFRQKTHGYLERDGFRYYEGEKLDVRKPYPKHVVEQIPGG